MTRYRVSLNDAPMSPIFYHERFNAEARMAELAECCPDAPLGVIEECETLRREGMRILWRRPVSLLSWKAWRAWLWHTSQFPIDGHAARNFCICGFMVVRIYSTEWKRAK